MIKMDYGDVDHRKEIEEAFPLLLDNEQKRQEEWAGLRRELCDSHGYNEEILPAQMKDIMVLPYGRLVDIYDEYDRLNISETDKDLHNNLIKLFSYEKGRGEGFKPLRKKIIDFFKKEGRFEIYTCHYCDMAYINCFTSGKRKRHQFDLDHVLPKGKCPLVALSLYNLVPSCPTCNSRIKGKEPLHVLLEQRKKLSPTSADYNFSGKVELWVKPIFGKIHNTNFLEHRQEYEIEFDTSQDPDYNEEINFFHLRERYNYHKCLALRLLDLKTKYTPAKTREIARIICSVDKNKETETTAISQILIDKLRSDILGLEFVNEEHRAFGKLYNDILNSD